MTAWNELFKTTIALLAIVNPFGGIPIFLSATNGLSRAERAKVAAVVALTVFAVLAVAALFGDAVLRFFGIGISSFLVGGVILLLLLSISMLNAHESAIRQTPEEAREAISRSAVAVVPLGIPLLAGPGAISSVIISVHQASSFAQHFVMLIPIALIALLVWLVFRLAMRIASRIGRTGLNIVTRLMGLILAAMAVEFIAKGLIELFPVLGRSLS